MFEEVMFLFFILFIAIAIFTFLVAFTGVMFEIWVHVFEWIRERQSLPFGLRLHTYLLFLLRGLLHEYFLFTPRCKRGCKDGLR